MRKVIASSLVLGMLGGLSLPAQAAEADAAPAAAAPPAEPAAAAPAAADGAPADSATQPDKDSGLVADAEAGGSPVELPGKTYLFVGARYRAIIVPQFMINMFGDGGTTVLVHGFGPEFVIRKNA